MNWKVYATAVATVTLVLPATVAAAYDVPQAASPPTIDGDPADPQWRTSAWRAIDKLLLGSPPDAADFSGRYKLLWDSDHLYLLAEIRDDVLYDGRPDPLFEYWEDDALEIFIDEDASGGDHQYNYNAFAYHLSLANHSVDIGPFTSEAAKTAGEANIRTYPHHIYSRWRRRPDTPYSIYWEVQISVFGDDFKDAPPGSESVAPVMLHAGKQLGFMLAYCDSDGASREHFLADTLVPLKNGTRNRAYITADVFGTLNLLGTANSE